jgi:acetyl-CoA carboxylase biotin carboxyl carrier protein
VADDTTAIRAQIPGIFYRRPDPGSPPYVEEGATVQPGTVVGLVEVMKQFHEVLAESAGTITAFEVDNEGTVSPGDVIARVAGDT